MLTFLGHVLLGTRGAGGLEKRREPPGAGLGQPRSPCSQGRAGWVRYSCEELVSRVVPGTQWDLALVFSGFGINFCPEWGASMCIEEFRGFRDLA